MRDYSKVRTSFWTDTKVRKMDGDSVLAFLYLLTCSHGNALGAFCVPRGYIEADLGWDAHRVDDTLSALSRQGVIDRDDTGWTRIRHYLKHNKPENDSVGKHLVALFELVPDDLAWKSALALELDTLTARWADRVPRVSAPSRHPEPEPEPEPQPEPNPSPAPRAKAKRPNEPPADLEQSKLDELVSLWPRKDSAHSRLRTEWDAALMQSARPSEILTAAQRYLALPEVRGREAKYLPKLEKWMAEGGWRQAGPAPNPELERRSALLRFARAQRARPDLEHIWTSGEKPSEGELRAAREDSDRLIVKWADTKVWDDALGEQRPDAGEVARARDRLLEIPADLRRTRVPA